MDIRNVIIITSDLEYLRHIRQYMKRCHSDLRLLHMASPEGLNNALAVCNACAVIIGMEFASSPVVLPSALSVVYFADNRGIMEHNGRPVFCKYSNGEALYTFITGMSGEPLRAPKVNAFFSIGGGMGASTVSAAYARKLAASGKSVLYICLDHYTDISSLFDGDCGSLSRLIIRRDDNAVNVGSDSGVDFVGCCDGDSDYRYFSSKPYANALTTLISAKPYDTVVIDGSLSDKLYREYAESYADRLYAVTSNDSGSAAKLHRLLSDFAEENGKLTSGIKGGPLNRCSVIANRSSSIDCLKLPEGVEAAAVIPTISNEGQNISAAMAQLLPDLA